MDKLNLPKMGERTWFETLVKALSTLDGRIVHSGFNRDYVLSDGLSSTNEDGRLGIDHIQIGDLHIVFGWGTVNINAKSYQACHITLPYKGGNYRALVGDAYSWDGDLKFASAGNAQVEIMPHADINKAVLINFIMMWSDD